MKLLGLLTILGLGPASGVLAQAASPGTSELSPWLTGSAVTILAAGVLGFVKGYIVPGYAYNKLVAENERLNTRLEIIADEDRSTLVPALIRNTEALAKIAADGDARDGK